MRKYLFIFKTQIISNLQYVGNVLIGFIGNFVMLFILFNLWKYLYSGPNELINGYNMFQMTWYVIITELLWMSLGGRKLVGKISEDVITGNVAYNINKPYSYVGYVLATHLGDIFIKSIVLSILFMITGLVFLGGFPSLTLVNVLVIVLTMILATVISTLFASSIGLLAFFFENSRSFWWLYSKFILILGTIFPIEFFPGVLQKVLSFSPVFVSSYGPAKLFVDFSWSTAWEILLAQLIYLAISYGICEFIYRKGVRKINVNGG